VTLPRSSVAAPAPGSRPVRASTQKKLEELLAKAAALIARKGFEATSMRDLGNAIDGSLAGLYHYFSSKDDLLFQLQYRNFGSLLESQQAVAAQPGTPEQRFARLITGHLRFYARHANELKVCTFELESLTGKPYQTIEAIRRQYYRLMTSVVADVIGRGSSNGKETRKSRHATLFIFGMLNWIFMWYEPSRHGTMEQIGEEMRELVLNGLRRTKRGGSFAAPYRRLRDS
jgi:TetR/AcrR family transcriptional regulator, cholesterol catabolism regulator